MIRSYQPGDLERLKERITESSKLEQKVKLIEKKYVTDVAHLRGHFRKEIEAKDTELDRNSQLAAVNQINEDRVRLPEGIHLQDPERKRRDAPEAGEGEDEVHP